jgi:antitoxin CcdA
MRIVYGERSMNAMPKKATNLSLQQDLLAEAKSLDLNLSAELNKALADIVKRKRAEKWLRENQEGIAAYNRYVEKHGVFGDEFRQW